MKLIFVAGLLLVSCKSEESTTSPEPPDEPKASAHPWDWVPTDPDLIAGKEVYLAECSGCHNEGEEGAPALTKSNDWKEREAKGLATLFDHALNGFDGKEGEMPARGGTPSLTDQEVKNAVSFMVQSPK